MKLNLLSEARHTSAPYKVQIFKLAPDRGNQGPGPDYSGLSIAGRFTDDKLPIVDIGPDEKAIPILDLLLDAGFKTTQICQGDENPTEFGVYDGKTRSTSGYVSLWYGEEKRNYSHNGLESWQSYCECSHQKIVKLFNKLKALLQDDVFFQDNGRHIVHLYWKCSPEIFQNALAIVLK